MTQKRAVIYARISVTTEESVSIEGQIKRCREHAEKEGWTVVGEPFVDDGVSGSKNKPEDRPGWRALLASPEEFDVVMVLKVDRLTRKVIDFLNVNNAVVERGAALASVNDRIDMSSPQGEAFATIGAVFAQLEAAMIGERVTAAQKHLLKSGRAVGGRVPFGWQNLPRAGGGFTLAQDPDTIEYVREMAARTLAGRTIYSTMQWLDDEGVPTPAQARWDRLPDDKRPKGKERPEGGWQYSSVERLLRHPILAGLTPYNRGHKGRTRGPEFVRDEDGLPLVNDQIALLSLEEWRALVKILDDRDNVFTRPRAQKSTTSPLLSGLVWCGDPRHAEPVRMHRSVVDSRPGYDCPDCRHSISSFEETVVEQFLTVMGDKPRWTVIEEIRESAAVVLPEIEQRLDELAAMIRDASREERPALWEKQATLLDLRDQKREEAPVVTYRAEPAGFFDDDWALAEGDEVARREVLGDALKRVVVRRAARPGRRTKAQLLERLDFEWNLERVGL
jgi:site-specific DNA recombinase